jgi:hypothetical protein
MSHRLTRPAPLLRLSLAAVLALAACADSSDGLVDAHYAVQRGDLEAAEEFLALVPDRRRDEIDAEIARVRARRASIGDEIAEVLGATEGQPLRDVLGELEALLRRESDPVVGDEVRASMSRVADIYAEGAHREGGLRSAEWWRRALASGQPDEDELAAPEVARRTPTVTSDPVPEPPPTVPARPAVVPSDDVDGGPPPSTIKVVSDAAWAELRAGRLAAARDVWLAGADRARYDLEREDYLGRARDLELRLLMREEIAAALRLHPETFAERGITAVTQDHGLERDGGPQAWSDVPLDELLILAGVAQLSPQAELGLILERLERRDSSKAWKGLAELVESGRVTQEMVDGIIARARDELVPLGGYAWRGGRWIRFEEARRQDDTEEIARLARNFRRAKANRRDAALAALREIGAEDEAREILAEHWEAALETFHKGKTAKRLTALAEQRAELDRRRAEALDLIFDLEEYFYPYRPPECPPERAKLYPAVQRRVDVLVGAVAEVWENPLTVAIGDDFQEGLVDAFWVIEREREHPEPRAFVADLPTWVYGIDPDAKELDLQGFAWDADELEQQRYNRSVLAYNQHLFARTDWGEDERAADRAEQRQVEVTNQYRLLFGRRALAWNPRIQAAAEDHSRYMADTGNFSHFEPDPESRGPGDRMRLRGYDRGISENIHMGSGDPVGAHQGWMRSSGHHRNLLMKGHREMASGLIGVYWA